MLSIVYNMLTTAGSPITTIQPSTWRTQISGVMGSTSLACWIVLLMPQLIEQWRLKSAEGIAIGFITIWFMGDIFNLIGALWAKLLPEVIFLAVWFCIADFLMIFSYVYYTKIYPKHHHQHHHHEHGQGDNEENHHHHHHHHHNKRKSRGNDNESSPLLNTTRSRSSSTGHGDSTHKRTRRRSSTLTDIALEPEYHSIFIKYILPILFVIGCGTLGFFISGTSGDNNSPDDNTPPSPPPSDDIIAIGPQIMGYCSALLYLGARIPQIIQNHQRKSVHGLSLLFFLFSTLGNLTYAGQILFYRNDSQYILLNLSWLLGSLGTIFEDSLIFLQFYMYRDNNKDEATVE